MPAVEVGPFEDLEVTEQFTEGFLACVIASMVGTREPDEVVCSIVGSDTVEVVALIALASRSYPRESDECVTRCATGFTTDGEIVLTSPASIRSVGCVMIGFDESQCCVNVRKEERVTGTIDRNAFGSPKRAETYCASVSCCEFRWETIVPILG